MKSENNKKIIDSCDYLGQATSATDCTGLIPAAPLTPEELDSYEALYPFLPSTPSSSPDKEVQ